MPLNAAEEESIEALRNWWSDNGRTLVATVVAAALAWGGWTLWQNARASAIQTASDLYEEILDLSMTEPGVAVDSAARQQVLQLATQLKADHAESMYARYGALFAAQQAVGQQDLITAERELQWILDNPPGGLFSSEDQSLLLTANLRLGRVLLAAGHTDRALDLVNRVDPGKLEAEFAELRGDIYLALGRTVDAQDAYIAAQQAGATSQFLQMKLDELAGDS